MVSWHGLPPWQASTLFVWKEKCPPGVCVEKRMAPDMRKQQKATPEEASQTRETFSCTSNRCPYKRLCHCARTVDAVNSKPIHLQNPRPLQDSAAKLETQGYKTNTSLSRLWWKREKNLFFSFGVCVAVWICVQSHKKKGGVCLKASQDFFPQYYKWGGKYPLQLLWDKLQHEQRYGSDKHRKLMRV